MFSTRFLFIGVCFIFLFMNCKNPKVFHQQLPEEFAKYQSIDSSNNIKAENAEMSLLLQSTEDIQSFQTPDNQIIIYTIQAETENSFYKINPSGVITDSLKIDSKPAYITFVKGFIIDKRNKQYYSWSFNGSKEPIDILLQNEQLDWDVKKQQEQLAYIIKNALFVYVVYQISNPVPQNTPKGEIQMVETMANHAVLTYLSGGEFYQFYTSIDVSDQFSYIYTQKLLLNNFFKRINPKVRVSRNKEVVPSPNINYRYFEKLKKEEVYFSGGGGNRPGYYEFVFHGNLYTDVTFKNDTLKLKEFIYLNKDGYPSAIRVDGKQLGLLTKEKAKHNAPIEAYMFYTSPHLDYALFSNDEKKIYIIR